MYSRHWLVVWYVGVSLVVLLFFFFKQKTAYEMRISDWSSDVCSSDLHRQPGGQPAPEPRRSRRGAPDPWWVAAGAFVGALALTVQIGRASCRERVCQYV